MVQAPQARPKLLRDQNVPVSVFHNQKMIRMSTQKAMFPLKIKGNDSALEIEKCK